MCPFCLEMTSELKRERGVKRTDRQADRLIDRQKQGERKR